MSSIIPEKLYSQILEYMPIACIDFVLYHKGKVLLTYRTQEPEKGQWWVQGGRIFKHELLEEALQRLAKREIGSEIKIIRKMGAYEYHSHTKAAFGVKTGTHAVVVVYLVKPLKNDFAISMDETHSKYKWIDHVEEDLQPYVKEVLKDSGVFGKTQEIS